MKIISDKTWAEHDGLIKKLIKEKNRQEKTIDILINMVSDLQAENARLNRKLIAEKIGATLVENDIDFPNSERKEDYESSNIFDL